MKQITETETVLPTPSQLKKEIPLNSERKMSVEKSRNSIRAILDGSDSRLMIISGPCSIHDRFAALEYAENLRELQKELGDKVLFVMRTYFEKPRSTVGWKGALYDPELNGSNNMTQGIREARALLAEITDMGIPCATEMLDPLSLPFLEDFLSYVAVGARTAESQIHRQALSGIDIPAGIKNSTDGSVRNAIDAVIASAGRHTMMGVNDEGQLVVKETAGNDYGHVILRGGNGAPNYSAEHIEEVGLLCERSVVDSAVVVDCSHQNSRKIHTKQIEVARTVVEDHVNGRSAHLRGIMLESNIYEGNQKITSRREDLQYGVSITDACLGMKETNDLIKELTALLEEKE